MFLSGKEDTNSFLCSEITKLGIEYTFCFILIIKVFF